MIEHSGQSRNDVYVVGWSHRAARPKVVQWTNVPPVGIPRFRMVDSVLAPDTSQEADARIMAAMGPQTVETMDFERFLVEVTKAQRFDTGSAAFGCEGQYLIGGHIQVTEVTASGVSKRVVHTWHEDEIGAKIRPVAEFAEHSNVIPFNRAERRRMARLAA